MIPKKASDPVNCKLLNFIIEYFVVKIIYCCSFLVNLDCYSILFKRSILMSGSLHFSVCLL